MDKKSIMAARKKPGGSNVGEYHSGNIFVGPAGGAPKGSYPITKGGSKKIDPKRVRAALALAHNAPNPQGIRSRIKSILDKKNVMQGLANRIMKGDNRRKAK